MTEEGNISQEANSTDKHYRVTNVKYGEKTVVGRVVGRNKTVIPEAQVAQLSEYHCTNKEMADFFDVPLQTFMDNFRDIITKHRLITKQRLRKKQIEVAMNGDKTMLIWLGRNMLGQTENPVSDESSQVLPWLEDDGSE